MKIKFKEMNILKIIFFLFIIFLNITDFLNLLEYDLDFFKKILSWVLIGYLFYYVSPTKIFIGRRLKIIDFILILIYSSMTILRSLFYYVLTLKDIENFYIFENFILFLKNLNADLIIPLSFLIGLILLIIINIYLLYNYHYEKNSLIGSINLNPYLEFVGIRYVILILIQMFFALTLFNLFMEWFALGVDAIVLVGGLIYYTILIIKTHTKLNIKYLNLIANSGNNFFQNVIETFKNKKTILIGISFILTLHLLVDGGAYLIPYSIGTGSSFYFLGLDSQNHIPLLNFMDVSNSQINKDFFELSKIKSPLILKIIFSIFVILYYIFSIFLFFSFLILPFYIIYKNINNESIYFNKKFVIVFLFSLILFFNINLINNFNLTDEEKNDLKNRIIPFKTIPLGINNIEITNIYGVDIYTNAILNKINITQIILSFILSFILTYLIYFNYKKIQPHIEFILYVLTLIFFIVYIIIFAYTYINSIYDKQRGFFMEDLYDKDNLIEYRELKYNEQILMNYKIFEINGENKIEIEIVKLNDETLFLRNNNNLILLQENMKIPRDINLEKFKMKEHNYFINKTFLNKIKLNFFNSNNKNLHNSEIFNSLYVKCRNLQKKFENVNIIINKKKYDVSICPIEDKLFLNFYSNEININEIEHPDLGMIYPKETNSTFYIEILQEDKKYFIKNIDKINYELLEKKLKENIQIEKSPYLYLIELIKKFTFRTILFFLILFYFTGILYYIYYYIKNNISYNTKRGYF
jgi:hypothetical protein